MFLIKEIKLMTTEEIKQKCEYVLNIFETGKKEGDYSKITIFADGEKGTRQITYGKNQTTEQSNLKFLILKYKKLKGIVNFDNYISKIGKVPLVNDKEFIRLLTLASKDKIMIKAQDDFFDEFYFLPALKFFNENKFTLPLSLLVIFDSFIHSGGIRNDIRNTFSELTPKNGGDEKLWITSYVNARHNWLKNHRRKILRKTIYRTRFLSSQINNDNWEFKKPLILNNIQL